MKNPANVNPSKMSRLDHLTWCKKRALEYLENGDTQTAVASMLSDMEKHPQNSVNSYVALIGMTEGSSGDVEGVRRWIEGFR